MKDCNSETATEEGAGEPLDELAQQRPRTKSAQEPETPLFLRYSSEGQKGDPQDEKDKSAE